GENSVFHQIKKFNICKILTKEILFRAFYLQLDQFNFSCRHFKDGKMKTLNGNFFHLLRDLLGIISDKSAKGLIIFSFRDIEIVSFIEIIYFKPRRKFIMSFS